MDLSPGDRVALLTPGSPAYVELVLALLARGVVPVPLDPNLTSAELEHLLPYVDPVLVVRDQAGVEDLLVSTGSTSTPAVSTSAPGVSTSSTSTAGGLPLARPMHLTSGTTGAPKGVWSGVLDEAAARALVAEERDLWGFAPSDINLVVSPLHHSAPLRFALGTLLAGGRLVGMRGFDPARVTDVIRRERPTTMFVVPTHLQRLFAHWDDVGAPDLTSFRLVAHAGAACPPALKRRLIAAFPPGTTWEFYGSTEGQFTACRSEEWLTRPGTVGRARPGRTLSVDDDGAIWCTVPEHARFRYWRAPEKTDQAWRGDSFSVGDLGRLDDEGYLFLDGRREDLVISGGVNVYPAEVEGVLAAVAGVGEIAVFGVPDEDWGQRVCAAYVGDADADLIGAYAREHLAPAKRPKEYVRLEALPTTATGKIRRLELPDLTGLRRPPPPGDSTSGGTAAG